MTAATLTGPDVDPPIASDPPGRIPRWLATLFPAAAPARAVTLRGVATLLAAVAVGTVVSLGRTSGSGPFQSIFQEDAKNVLNDAYNMPAFTTLLRPINGYLTIVPRLIGEFSIWFPVKYAAAAMSASAAVIAAALVAQVYVASGAHLRNQPVRVAVSAPMLFAAVAENWRSEIYNRPVCLHFFAAYAVFWLMLWTPASRLGRTGAMATVWGGAASSIIFVAFIPLAAVRLYQRRDRYSLFMLVPLVACAAVNLGGQYIGLDVGARASGLRLAPIWALTNFVTWAVPQSLLGWRATEVPLYNTSIALAPSAWLILLAWAIVAAVIGIAVIGARRGFLRPNWTLSSLAGLHAVGLFCFLVMAAGTTEQRYLYPVEMLIFAALISLLVPAGSTARVMATPAAVIADPSAPVAAGSTRTEERTRQRRSHRLGQIPVAALALLILVVGAFNYRFDNTYRGQAPSWSRQVAVGFLICRRGTTTGHINLRGAPQPFASVVSVPCSYIVGGKSISCWGPECQWVEPPVATEPTPSPTPTPSR